MRFIYLKGQRTVHARSIAALEPNAALALLVALRPLGEFHAVRKILFGDDLAAITLNVKSRYTPSIPVIIGKLRDCPNVLPAGLVNGTYQNGGTKHELIPRIESLRIILKIHDQGTEDGATIEGNLAGQAIDVRQQAIAKPIEFM